MSLQQQQQQQGAASKPKKPAPWKTSKAKKQLQTDILSGVVAPDMKPTEIYNMHDGIYHPYAYKNFITNLRNLRIALGREQAFASQDAADISHDRELHPAATHNPGGYPRWNGSDAAAFLAEDFANGLTSTMHPRELRETREEYKQFPLNVFRSHIHQLKRQTVGRTYWKAWYAERKGKKKKKKKKKNKDTKSTAKKLIADANAGTAASNDNSGEQQGN